MPKENDSTRDSKLEEIIMKSLALLVLGILLGLGAHTQSAQAQEFGAVVGVHQTTADANVTGVSSDGKFNFKAGLGVNFELADAMRFRTGVLYSQRHFELTDSTGGKTKINFAYLDVPANFQYNISEMVGFFGGLVVAINTSDDVSPDPGTSADADQMVPLIDLGVNFLFNDLVGFDLYYERGLGEFANNLENFSTFGANFLFWF